MKELTRGEQLELLRFRDEVAAILGKIPETPLSELVRIIRVLKN